MESFKFEEILQDTENLYTDLCFANGVEIIGLADRSDERWAALKLKCGEKLFVSIGSDTAKFMASGFLGLPTKNIATFFMNNWISSLGIQLRSSLDREAAQSIILRGLVMQVSYYNSVEDIKRNKDKIINPFSYFKEILK